ncbi:hypothetical protein N7574_13730 [Acinetobacter ursingii]|uniref:Uncharacterized protein n=3 Tax=Acinetobacter TaxID=469 RepID=N9C179_9GAMM|nr:MULTISPECIES: hypothetical protein [Acinetobacter]ENV79567.1 hypothetical protein F942_01875 [Acinetobacter ursingii ANC 3649]MCU4480856.1 hypothetical protein [Acinetobacter ursingii]MCU4505185.1 hypothetical protein [Acinetobacter ursingii]MCU4569005.1 hypothetical protein [Acinetobacter ursingii]MDG9950358.1 hypothetical protein [Acinetobacter ursingii]
MSHYYKTAQGHTALENRQFNLNVRQRRLLLLIGTEDFNKLSDQFRQKIASPELLEQLEAMGLIQAQTFSSSITTPKPDTEIPPSSSSTVSRQNEVANIQDAINHPTRPSQEYRVSDDLIQHQQVEITPMAIMAFDEIKTLMAETLSRYCGLLARQLLEQIKNASNVKQLKICQMQWITHLQETRIPPQQLNQQLQQVNFALQHLQLEQ